MVRKLNLKAKKKDGDTIIISWRDPLNVEAHPRLKRWHQIIFSIWSLISLYLIYRVYFDDALWRYFYFHLTLDWIAPNLKIYTWSFIGVGLALAGVTANIRPTLRNEVHIGKSNLKHRDLTIPTASITRFEYGTVEQLTGSKEASLDGKVLFNPSIIRLWVNDSSAYEISRNNWQMQVNHEIHATLTKALEAVRDVQKQEENAKKFGVVDGETGMPDY